MRSKSEEAHRVTLMDANFEFPRKLQDQQTNQNVGGIYFGTVDSIGISAGFVWEVKSLKCRSLSLGIINNTITQKKKVKLK